jgi:hypothetical protein
LPQALWVANSLVYVCTHPSSTLAACQAAPITTYTDSTEGTTCPSTEQMVQLPGNTCTASSGVTANVGFWYGDGVFDYWIVSSYGTYGPFSGNSSNFPSSCGNPIGIPCGGTGATTAAGALAELGGVSITGAAFTGPVSINSTLSVANLTSIGPRYDVTNPLYGAVGNGSTDDTAAIQAAFNACFNNANAPFGGIIELPGPHTYVISSTINAWDGCQIEGTIGSSAGGYQQPEIQWNGPAAGAVYAITAVTTGTGLTPTVSSPYIAGQTNRQMPSYATLTATNTAAVGNWVYIQGCTSTAGQPLNHTVAQVSAVNLSSSSITVGLPFQVATLSASDSCTATVTNVGIAYDAQARYQQANTSFVISSNRALSNALGVGIYFGSRVDTGTRVWNVQVSGANLYAYYFAGGGINVDFDKGWRADAIGEGATYWRVTGSDSVDISNGTTDNNSSAASTEGSSMVFDAGACGSLYNNYSAIMTTKHLKIEVNKGLNPGMGAITLYDCPTNPRPGQLQINGDGLWIAPYTTSIAGVNISPFAVIPPNDLALEVSLLNSLIPEGNQTTNFSPRWLGMPYAQSFDMAGYAGVMPVFSYMPPLNTANSAYGPTQFLNDTNFAGITWAYSTRASMMLYSDTAFAALPNGTSLAAGQLIAPPSYWLGANGKRYAQQSVYTAGTTGTLNGGATTCTKPSSGAGTLQCNTAAGLMLGQYVTWNGLSNQIDKIDDTVDSAAQVYLQTNPASGSNLPLTFTAPVLGPEMQLPTKSAAAPTTLAWSQGDTEQNSGATANGVAAWVNVAAGTPGTWAGIPLGDSSGQIAVSQLAPASLQGTDTKVLTAGTVSGTGITLCTDANGGATTSGCSSGSFVTSTPYWLQYLGTGADGSYEYSSTASCTTGPTHCVINCTSSAPCNITNGEILATSFQIDSGAYVYTSIVSSMGFVVHSQGACNLYGTMLLNGVKSTWPNTNKGICGASSGGSGGGSAAGASGVASYPATAEAGTGQTNGGAAGASSGGNGGNGASIASQLQRALAADGAGGLDGLYLTGATGVQGGSTGGAGGYAGQGLVMSCASINGTGGVIDLSGAYGMPPAANSTGAGSGGGGGVGMLSSQTTVSTWPTIYAAGGPGGLVTVPEALGTSGSCTTQPKATLGVTSGALNGTCTVVQAGAGCGSGTNVTFNVVGGGGTLGTGTVNPTWSGGVLASCTTTAGTSTGYTAATYTTAGTGGDGGNGWYVEFAGW